MITISYLIVLIIFSTKIHIISQILYVKLTISITTVPLKSEKFFEFIEIWLVTEIFRAGGLEILSLR